MPQASRRTSLVSRLPHFGNNGGSSDDVWKTGGGRSKLRHKVWLAERKAEQNGSYVLSYWLCRALHEWKRTGTVVVRRLKGCRMNAWYIMCLDQAASGGHRSRPQHSQRWLGQPRIALKHILIHPKSKNPCTEARARFTRSCEAARMKKLM